MRWHLLPPDAALTRPLFEPSRVASQWTSYAHPDPSATQLQALKRVVRTLMAGETEVRTNAELEQHYNVKLVTTGAEWKQKLKKAVVWIE